jgi:hypothetical protein
MGPSRNITVEKEHKNNLNKYQKRSYCSKTARRDFQDSLCVNWTGVVVMVLVVGSSVQTKKVPTSAPNKQYRCRRISLGRQTLSFLSTYKKISRVDSNNLSEKS